MSEITISIKNLLGRAESIKVKTTDTISTGKIKYNKGSPQWKFNSRVLKDDKTFDFYNIEDEDTIISNDRSEGGNFIIKKDNI